MSTRSIERELDLACDCQRAFQLLVTPSAIRDWWQASSAIVLPGVGGLWSATWGGSEDEPDFVTAARLREFDAPRRLVLDQNRYHSRLGALPFEVEFALEPQPTGCRLRVRQSGFPAGPEADAHLAGCEQGWTDSLAGLERCARATQEKHG